MQTKQDGRLGTEKIGKLMLELALPSVLAQIVNVLYNIVDRIYIGRIPDVGSLALTGVGVTFPIITIISAFAGFASGGGAPLAAIALGQKNRERAEKILGSSTSLLLFFSVLLMAFFFVFQTPLLYLFGASDNTIGYASTYISIYLVGTVFVELAVGLNTFISCQGHARTAMCSVLIGAVVNIGLDPVFIFVLHMGVSGAALATVLSQALSAAWVLRFLTSKKSGIRLSLRTMKPDFAILGSVMALGISPFIMSATESAITIVMNHGLQTYGSDLYVGSMTILQSVLQLIFVPVNGFTNGVQPIISYNFGAGQFDRVRQTIRRMIAITFTATFVYVVFAMLRPASFRRSFHHGSGADCYCGKSASGLHCRHGNFRLAERRTEFLSRSWPGEDFSFYRTAPESHSSDPACTHSAAFLRRYGRLLCGTDRRCLLRCHCRYAVSLQYLENSFEGNSRKGDSHRGVTEKALRDLFHAPSIINFFDRFGGVDGIFREKHSVNRVRHRTDLFSFLYRGFDELR